MTIPASILGDLEALNTAYVAAAPLANATPQTIQLLALQADAVVADLDAAVGPAAGGLDAFVAPVMPAPLANAVLAVLDESTTQCALTDIRGVIGRLASNLAQAS